MGVLQRAMVRSCPHVWFERAEMKDRHLVTKRSVFHSSISAPLFRRVTARLARLYFLSVAVLLLREVGIFLAVKPSRVSVSLIIQTRTDMFWKVATEQ